MLGTVWGSLAGGGTVFNGGGATANGGAAAALSVGFNNSSTTYSGQIMRANDATPALALLTKIGTGTLSMTGAENYATGSTGAVSVSGGTLAFSGAGAWFAGTATPALAGTFNVNNGGTLLLDNSTVSGMAFSNRLGLAVAGTLNLQGGTLQVNGNGNDSTATVENITTFNVVSGGGVFTLNANAGSQLNSTITTLSGENATGTALFRGLAGTAAANGNATLAITTPTLIAGQGTTGNGTSTMGVRRDIIADASATGLGTGFLVKDSGTNVYRALGGTLGLASTEYKLTPATWALTQNAGINASSTVLSVNANSNTLSAAGTSSLDSAFGSTAFGLYGTSGLLAESLNINAVLVQNGGTFSSNVGSLTGVLTTSWAFHTIGTAVMNVNGYFGIGNTGGFVKADDGTLNFNKTTYNTGVATVNGGTLNLISGQDNTLPVVPGITTPTVSALAVNGTSAVVDLNGRNQAVGLFSSSNILPGQSGKIVNSGATPVTFTSTGGGTFAGQIGGGTVATPANNNLAFTRAGNNTTVLTSASTYSGATTVRGGTLQLRDSGSILNSSVVNVEFGGLNIDQSGLNPAGSPNPARIASSTQINLHGSVLTLTPGGSIDAAASFDTVNLTGGSSIIAPLLLASQGTSTTLNIGNLTHVAGSTVHFSTVSGQNAFSAIGTLGINQATVFLSNVDGVAPANQSFLGSWVLVNQDNFGAYSTTQGVGAYSTTGFPAYATTLATGNITNTATAPLPLTLALTATGALRLSATVQQDVTFTNATDVLDVETGGILVAFNNHIVNIGVAAGNRGVLTAGTAASTGTTDIITSGGGNNSTAFNINSAIKDTKDTSVGGTGIVRFVKSGVQTGAFNLSLTGANTYTGGTLVDSGLLTLSTPSADGATIFAVPGNLTIENSGTVTLTAADEIKNTAAVTINGAGTLNMSGTNMLASLAFNNSGSAANPSVVTSTLLTLSAATAISSNNDNLATTPVVSGALTLSNSSPAINVTGLSPDGLQISAIISTGGGAISKTGAGALVLSGASTFNNGFNLNAGSLIIGVSSTGAITNGPVGTGTLAISNLGTSTTLLSSGNFSIANPTTVGGDFTFGGVTATNNLTLTGAMNLGAAGRTVTVSSPAVTATISGALTSTNTTGASFTKAGPGFLVLSFANIVANFGAGSIAITGGVLRNGIDNALPIAPRSPVSAGAGYDLAAFNQTLLNLSGSGFITNSGALKTLVIGANTATDVATNIDNTFGGAFVSSTLAVVKLGLGTLTLTNGGTSAYGTASNAAGASLTIVSGKVLGAANNAFPGNGVVTVANATTSTGSLTATLDTGTFDQTIGGLAATPATAAGTAAIAIGSGKTLTVNGSVTLGSNSGGTDVSNINFTGGGTLAVVSSGGAFQVGGASTTSNGALGTAGTTVQSGGTLRLGVDYTTPETLTLNGTGQNGTQGALALAVGSTAASFSGPIIIGTAGATITPTTTVAAATGTLGLGGGINLATNGTTVTFAGVGNVNIGGPITTSAGVVGNVAVNGSTLNLNVASTYSGGTSVANGGTIVNGVDNALPVTTTLTIGAGGGFDLHGHNQTLAGLTDSGSGSRIVTNNGPADGVLGVSGGTSSFGGVIQDGTSATGVNVSGAGTVFALTGVNTYTGGTVIDGGTLQINSDRSLGAIPAPAQGDGIASSGPGTGMTVINGGTLEATENITTARNFQLGSATSTIAVDVAKTYAVSGVFADGSSPGKLNKAGTGTLVLTGANVYTGGTDISGGTLQVGNSGTSGALGTGPVTNNGALSFIRTDLVTVADPISGSGTVNQVSGTLVLNGAVTGQNVNVFGGVVKFGAGDTTAGNLNHSLRALSVTGGGSAEVVANTGTPEVVKATSFALTGTSFLNLTNNNLIVTYPSGLSSVTAISAAVSTGFAGGAWNGPGINSSVASTDTTYGVPYITGLGVIDNNFNGSAIYTSFLGRSVTQDSVLVRYTLYGDANLDGAVTSSDYTLIDSAYAAVQGNQAQPINWLNGDFNYDGAIDGADYALIDTAYAFSHPGVGGAAARGGVWRGLHRRSRVTRRRQRSHQRAGAGQLCPTRGGRPPARPAPPPGRARLNAYLGGARRRRRRY